MKPLNIFTLSRIQNMKLAAQYEQQLSQREEPLQIKQRELESLRIFVDKMIDSVDILFPVKIFDTFFYSFQIDKVSKEFDLLRLSDNLVVNIELKSEPVSQEKILKQLQQNTYYLGVLNRNIISFTFVSKTNELLRLSENKLVSASMEEVYTALNSQTNFYADDICKLFCASAFLISPMNTPDRFLNGSYFLTSHQEKIKSEICRSVGDQHQHFFGITGAPGTGKTLMIYDLAITMAAHEKCCIVHCGIRPDGLEYLNRKISNVDIIEVKNINDLFPFSNYKYVFVDESQRIYKPQFNKIVSQTQELGLITFFSFDTNQTLSKAEKDANIAYEIEQLKEIKIYKLKNKIRTNRQLASFITRLMGRKADGYTGKYSDIEIAYASNIATAQQLLVYYQQSGYTFIRYTGSNYKSDSFADYSGGVNTHHVIGQEFEKVVMIMNKTFKYDEVGRLRASVHPNPDYLYTKLLYQGLSRVRDKLAIIVVDNDLLLEKILDIISC